MAVSASPTSGPIPEEKTPIEERHGDNNNEPSSVSKSNDVALTIVGEHAQEIDPAMEARVIRKIDWFLIPAMFVGVLHRSNSFLRKLINLQATVWFITTKPYWALLRCSA